MKSPFRHALFVAIATWHLAAPAAPAPTTIYYQGYLTTAVGAPVNGTKTMTFRLYDAETGGAPRWSEVQTAVSVVNGMFSTALGAATPIPAALFDGPHWLSVQIDNDPAEMSPRRLLSSVPFAFRATSADALAPGATLAGSQVTGSITTATIPVAQVIGAVPGPQGPVGPTGATGPIGPQGPAGVAPSNVFVQNGNAFGAIAIIGTTDNWPIIFRVNNSQVMRYQPGVSPTIIGGHAANTADGVGAIVAGGGWPFNVDCRNLSTGLFNSPCINQSRADFSAVSGGVGNVANAAYAIVAGGYSNFSNGTAAAIGGGTRNATAGVNAMVGGGSGNNAGGNYSTVGGGSLNNATGIASAIGGGSNNAASGNGSLVAGGGNNTASAWYSTVAGGFNNVASGNGSMAAGERAKAVHANSFVWGGSAALDSASIAAGDFVAFAPAHVRFYTGPAGAAGCVLSSASGWACSSDRQLKTNIKPVDPVSILRHVAAMPVSRWNMKDMPGVTQIGPMAQDFFAAFHLGASDKMISTTDAQGVAFAAIQGLNQLMSEKDTRIEKQESRIRQLEESLAAIQAKLGLR
jgi:Chaperone of endosialidase